MSDASQDLFAAIKKGDVGEVQKLSSADPSLVRVPNKRGELPLHAAVEAGDSAAIEALLAAGAEVDGTSTSFDGQTALLAAVWGGDDVAVQTLLRHGADPNAVDSNGRNAMHACALIGDLAVFQLLEDPAEHIIAPPADAAASGSASASASPSRRSPRKPIALDVRKAVMATDCDGLTPIHGLCREYCASPHVMKLADYMLTRVEGATLRKVLAQRTTTNATPLHLLAAAAGGAP